MQTKTTTMKLVMTALMMCLIIVSIVFIRIPIPFTQGYVHLGDAMIFLAVLILGWKHGALAAAVGGCMADILGGFAMWAPWTFAIKGVMAIILGLVIMLASRKENIGKAQFMTAELVGMTVSGAFMTAAYYVAEGVIYGNWIVPVMGIPWNIGQFAVGMVVATVIATTLCKTAAKNFFTYRLPAGGSKTAAEANI